MDNWRVLTMPELYDYFNVDSTTFIKPTFPTKRWGYVYTKTATTNLKTIKKMLAQLRAINFDVKIEKEKENKQGIYYCIKINNYPKNINHE